MDNLSLVDLLRGSLNSSGDASPTALQFAQAAERIARRTLKSWAGGIVADRGLLDDVVQESLLRIWVNRRRCHAANDGEAAAWMTTIVRCAAIDALRVDKPSGCRFLELDVLDTSLPDRDASDVETPALAKRLAELSWALGDDAVSVLWLRLVLGLEWKEIGDREGVSWTAARRRYQRASKRLRALAISDPTLRHLRTCLRD